MPGEATEIYTDGSCHTRHRIGAWVAIVFTGTEKKILSATVEDTTHNRMELTAVIKGIEYIKDYYPAIRVIKLFSDSQYVVGLPARKEKLLALSFATKKGSEIQNADLVKKLLVYLSMLPIELIKVKAHKKNTGVLNYNIEADKLSRKMVRDVIRMESSTSSPITSSTSGQSS